MAKIFLYLDEIDLAQSELKMESNNLLVYIQNLDNFSSPFGGSWWTGGGAGQFFSGVSACVNEIRDFANQIVNVYDRVCREEDEWANVDTSFRYSRDGARVGDLPTLDLASGSLSAGDGFVPGLGMKFSFKDPSDPSQPWQFRYPADSDTASYKGWFGNTINEETTYGDFDAGVYAGLTDEGAGIGLYAKGESYKKVYTSALFGLIPVAMGFHGPSYEVDAGTSGLEVDASVGGTDLNIAGLDVGIEAGWGWGSDGDEFKVGPFSIGLDLGVYEDAAGPSRPPY